MPPDRGEGLTQPHSVQIRPRTVRMRGFLHSEPSTTLLRPALSCCISSRTSSAGNKPWSLSPAPEGGGAPRALMQAVLLPCWRKTFAQRVARHVLGALSRRGSSCLVGRSSGSASPEPSTSRPTWSFWWVCTHACTHTHTKHPVFEMFFCYVIVALLRTYF